MSEVLSQSEIDNLFAALSTGELDVEQIQEKEEKQTRVYDFRRPAKFSKEHLRTLEIIFEHYGRLLATNLPIYMRKNVQIGVASSEAMTFSEFFNALSTPVIMGIGSLEPLPGNMIIELSPNLGYAIIDRMLGGEGGTLEKSRDFTRIERIIIEKILIVCMQHMREPWKNVLDINPVLERLETNSQFAQIISPNDMVALVTLDVKIGDVQGFMNMCLPYFTLEDVMDKLNTRYWYANLQETKNEDYEEHIESLIRRVDIPIKAILGNSTVSVNDFVNLQIGDVIRLDSHVDSELSVYVGNIRKFTALPGASKENYAVRVMSVIREGE